ncbi:MAG: ATP-dependent helicase, partial [Lachnospiraceae bacterium]|nr:ATP-dependent helicase [Lachnospiraceae bacterium]
MNLDPQQTKAVEHGDGPALVLAGPGSGKTAVITERTLRLVKKTKAPRRVLVITFTKAAAKEMEERYNAKASVFERGVNFGTFHAVFFRILREAPAYRGVKIIRNEDRYATALRVFSKKCGSRRFANDDVNHFLSAVSRKKSGKQEDGTGLPISASEFDEASREYDKELERRGFIDFDDILTKCLSYLQNDVKALKRWREAFDYFLVDEYQDINRVQYDIIKLLAAPKNNLFVVGDDDQSIYAFRGAEPALAKEFLKDFPDAKTILLDRNYRSASCITRASLAVVKHNKERFEKKITADTQRKGKVESVCFEDRREEYEKLAEMLKAKGAESSAVLFRTNRQPAMLAHILEEKGVKFTVYGKLESLYTHHVTQDILAYARIAAGSAERADFLRICNRPERYIKRELFTNERVDLDELEKRAAARLEDVSPLVSDIKAIRGLDPYGVVMYVKKAAGYDEYLKNCA